MSRHGRGTTLATIWLVSIICALLVMMSASTVGASARVLAWAAGTPLRQVDWHDVLASEAGLTYADEPPFPGSPLSALVTMHTAEGEDEVAGYPLFDQIDYGDMDGDGAEEAVIPLFSGGMAGTVGLLLYREGPDRPKLVLGRSGYKLGVKTEGGRLVVYEPSYVGFEPNCCPSASTIATFRLVGNRLERQAFEVEPNEAQEVTVSGFYDALGRDDYDAAYEFYSPALKAASPFDRWRQGYRNTQRLEVSTSPGPTPNQVGIDLRATDSALGGGTVTRHFRGTWTVIWSSEGRRWLLDKAQIAEVP